MRLMKIEAKNFGWGDLVGVGAAAILFACLPIRAVPQEKGQKTFSSAEEASQALVKAAQDNDEKMLIEIVGKSAKEIIASGDDKQDAQHRAHFVKRYEEMHRLFKEPDGTTTLYDGVDNWPTPMHLVNKGSVWHFDGEAAQLAAPEKEYFAMQKVYAAKIASDPDQKNGLYWSGEPKSPIGPKIATADTTSKNASPTPFRGYYFRVLTDQGKDAPGGAKSYMVDGKMTGGFAIMAYPVEYRSSGVMTFMVGSDGVVHEKDLGKKTETEAKAIKTFNPDSSWHPAEEQQETTNAQTTK